MDDSSIIDEAQEPPSKKRKEEESIELPPELKNVDFSTRITWRKFHPYSDTPLPLTPEDTEPFYSETSPALCHHIHNISNRARAGTLHLHGPPIPTPMFMPVGTKGCLKAVSFHELTTDLQCPIILANTYHMALQPGTELLHKNGGLRNFQGQKGQFNLLTDSGGFQMVSLVKLSQVTEEGVTFESPFDGKPMLLRPEDSMRHQHEIGADIIMALDDVVSSVAVDPQRFVEATHRTLRWYDRCYQEHEDHKQTQNLFPIVQGGLDTELCGLREQCLAGFRHRDEVDHYTIPGYAIGGLAGGEEKDSFWRVVDQCCKALPDDKPRYLMGVGYPLDLVVCTALGCDLYDCVYPTRTGRFGVALVPGKAPGTMRLKAKEHVADPKPIQEGCPCQACRLGVSRARLNGLLKADNPLAVELVTQHNVAYMMSLVRSMRQAILDDSYADFARDFVKDQYPGVAKGGEECPKWVVDALEAAGIAMK